MTDPTLTRDVYLGGRFTIAQPRDGYRAATDPLLLAAAVPARAGQSVLELGCGAGTALIALATRVAGLSLSGIERQAFYADLARRNMVDNRLEAQIETGDLRAIPAALRVPFDHVLANPPYYRATGPAARDAGRDAALREETPLSEWVDCALRRLKTGGYLTLIHLAERLPELLIAIGDRAACKVRPIAARQQRAAGRIVLQARKGSRAAFVMQAPLVMHEGAAHIADGDDFTARARAILRDGAALDWD
ncbi:tRNA1(Val) (adenine(37)-N6)-methyltransferase [Pararhodobacter marinus]|uniref:tRNA1(Val) (adenine(37)-N6)-methyltransferase n=1 Tax=Pararhodobacter marinus TaxID=2184063 RepID=UPI00351134DA